MNAPKVYLGTSGQMTSKKDRHSFNGLSRKPSLLTSFVYLEQFQAIRSELTFEDWAIDSGAFSAFKSGTVIDNDQYLDKCLELLKVDKQLVEIFALDVIGDHKTSLKNTERAWERKVPAIPTYHLGEPVEYLLHIAKQYPKIAIGGVALKKGGIKSDFARAVFSRVWPKPIHGFGYGSRNHILAFPFHSTDSTNWEAGPSRFGRWNAFGDMSIRGSKQNLKAEVEYYLRIEDEARQRWSKEMELIKRQGPAVRLVYFPAPFVEKALAKEEK
jgi:hypothetical protein